MDWAGRTEDRGNADETAGSFFYPSGPSEFGYLIHCKNLILQLKLTCGADRMPFHPVNPGLNVGVFTQPRADSAPGRPTDERRECDVSGRSCERQRTVAASSPRHSRCG